MARAAISDPAQEQGVTVMIMAAALPAKYERSEDLHRAVCQLIEQHTSTHAEKRKYVPVSLFCPADIRQQFLR